MRIWLRDKRLEAGLTMKEIGEKLHISESYYCEIENGNRQKKMDIVLLSGLSTILGVPIAEIVELESQTN
jgi:transcriptional regulator with XRE-family HTH domain